MAAKLWKIWPLKPRRPVFKTKISLLFICHDDHSEGASTVFTGKTYKRGSTRKDVEAVKEFIRKEKVGFSMSFWKVLKRGLVTLACLMLVSPLITGSMTQVQANPDPLFTIHLVGSSSIEFLKIEWEFFFDIAYAIKAELAKIGINVEIHFVDPWDPWPWEPWGGWNLTWDEGGWDMGIVEWGWMPTDLLWFEGCYSEAGQPPRGWNYFGWENEIADYFLHLGMTTVNPTLRKEYIWTWQEEYMHDPPAPVMYYPIVYEVTDANLEGWDKVVGFWDTDDLKFANTTLEDDVTLEFGSAEDLITLNPLFTLSIGSQIFTNQVFDMLMKTSKDPATGQAVLKPSLAREPPVYSPDGMNATVYLRENVTWHDGYPFNATDVKFTFDAVTDGATRCTGYGDFAPVIDRVEIVDEFTVVFHFKAPSPHFSTLLADDYGAMIIPEHVLRNVTHRQMRKHSTNTDTPMPGTGRWKFVEWVRDEYWLVEVNPDYFLGESMIDRIYNYVITDPAEGLTALQNHEIHVGNCWSATMEQIQTINQTDPTLKVVPTLSPEVTHLGFNLHHPILSNRYVRQAIAHAIPYDHIINDVLPTISRSGNRATAPVTPLHGWLYNTELQPYEHNIAKAQQYMDMWKYAQPEYAPEGSANVTLGCVGDADFSGLVDLDDFYLWRNNFGTTSTEWPFVSGRPIDPDFTNDDYVDLDDFYAWIGAWGKEYPFSGAR